MTTEPGTKVCADCSPKIYVEHEPACPAYTGWHPTPTDIGNAWERGLELGKSIGATTRELPVVPRTLHAGTGPYVVVTKVWADAATAAIGNEGK